MCYDAQAPPHILSLATKHPFILFVFQEWGSDDLTIYYTRPDGMGRPYALLRHTTCQSIFQDVVLHEEKDERYP